MRPPALRRGAHSPTRQTTGAPKHQAPTAHGRTDPRGTLAGAPATSTGTGRRRQRPPATRKRHTPVILAPVLALAAGIVVLGAATAPVVIYRSSLRHRAAAGTSHASAGQRASSTGTTAAPASSARCPLTGLPAPGGVVPARPALAVKVDNYPDARPQSALDQADIVFEEPVEGGVTRLVAVYQCQAPALIGPVRSAREPDVAIAEQLSDPLLVHAGGIQPILAMLQAADLVNIDVVFSYSSLVLNPPGRVAPYDTYVAANTMWQLAPKRTAPPAPLFSYDAADSQQGTPTTSVHIPFSSYSDATWTWSQSDHNWQLAYSGVPATTYSGSTLADPQPVAVANVVVETVHTFLGPWVENSLGAHEVEVDATGTGPLLVLRDGRAITGTWKRTSLLAPAQLRNAAGHRIDLTPGETWVELVPATVPVTTVPSSSTPATSGTTPASSGTAPAPGT